MDASTRGTSGKGRGFINHITSPRSRSLRINMGNMARRKKTTATTPEINQTAAVQPIQTSVTAVDRERIASRAYELYIARGGTHGRDMEDWLTAEAELASTTGAAGGL